MARTDALSIVTSTDDKAKLAELYGGVIDAVRKGAVSQAIKATNFSGDPLSGSVEFKRFVNGELEDYGTARSAGEGAKLKADPITVNLDDDKEIVEEVANKDIDLFGIPALVERRQTEHVETLVGYLDRRFFAVAEAAGTALTLTALTIEEQLEEAIQAVETTENDYVDGVPRERIVVTLKPSVYGKLRNHFDTITVPGVDGGEETIVRFHGARVFSNFRQTSVMIVMVDGAVAQPVVVDQYDAERIPLSNDSAIELFASLGTKALTPDLIRKVATLPVAPEEG